MSGEMGSKAVFVAATAQHVGKTTTCLGIYSGLQKRFSNVGFMKPVGQRHVPVKKDLHVDKDVVLFHERFGLKSNYADLSPVIFKGGFSRNFLDGQVKEKSLKPRILDAYQKISSSHDYTLVEGTGHAGVGSIIDLSNADVAAALELEVILVSTGGIGSAFDQLALNRQLFLAAGVPIRAIILNKVLPEKRDMVLEYASKALKRWDIPLAGCIPYSGLLDAPSMRDYEVLFQRPLIAGLPFRYRHFTSERLALVDANTFRRDRTPNMLIITHATRSDIIRAAIDEELASKRNHPEGGLERGMILTGHTPPTDELIDAMQEAEMPVLYAPVSSFKAMQMLSSFTAKIRNEDVDKVEKAIQLVEEHVDFDLVSG
jgi:phosphate acetyltransferase